MNIFLPVPIYYFLRVLVRPIVRQPFTADTLQHGDGLLHIVKAVRAANIPVIVELHAVALQVLLAINPVIEYRI